MTIIWTLKHWLATERHIVRPGQLRRLLAEQADYHLSRQAVRNLLTRPPQALRLRTIQALCSVLNCALHDFCTVLPDAAPRPPQPVSGRSAPRRPPPQRRTRRVHRAITFPDPQTFSGAVGTARTRGES